MGWCHPCHVTSQTCGTGTLVIVKAGLPSPSQTLDLPLGDREGEGRPSSGILAGRWEMNSSMQ